MAEGVSSKSPNRFINKYVEYRRQYDNSRNFSAKLEDAKTPDPSNKTPPADTATKDLKTDKPDDSKPKVAATKNSQIGSGDAGASPASAPSTDASPVLPYAGPPSTSIPNMGSASNRMMDKVKEYEPLIRSAAARYNIDPNWIAGVIWQESRGNPRAVSHCGAMGLMQLMPGTAKQLGVSNAFDISQNIDGGAKYLRQMYDKFGRIDFATAAYNAGPGNVSKHGGIPPFRETQDYVPKVLGYSNSFKVASAFEQEQQTSAVRV